jgi:hypothetical protein
MADRSRLEPAVSYANDRSGQMDSGAETACGLVMAGIDRTKLFALGEEVLDQMACRTRLPVEASP